MAFANFVIRCRHKKELSLVKNDDYIVPSVNYCDGLGRFFAVFALFVFMLSLLCFCVLPFSSANKDLCICYLLDEGRHLLKLID